MHSCIALNGARHDHATLTVRPSAHDVKAAIKIQKEGTAGVSNGATV